MPISQVDKAAALIVIDLQKGLAGIAAAHPMAEVVGKAAQLTRAFRERGLPVVLVTVAGRAPGRTEAASPVFSLLPDWAELVPELDQQSSDHLVTKQRPGAFIGTGLDAYLRRQEVSQVFIVGIATSVGVEATARSAYDHGYNVVLVTDAMTDRDPDAHRYCVEKVFPRIGETGTAGDVLRLLRG